MRRRFFIASARGVCYSVGMAESRKIKASHVVVTVGTLLLLAFGAVSGLQSCEERRARLEARAAELIVEGCVVEVRTLFDSGQPVYTTVEDLVARKHSARRLKSGTVCTVVRREYEGGEWRALVKVPGGCWWVDEYALERVKK